MLVATWIGKYKLTPVEYIVTAWDFCLEKRVKFKKYVSVLQNDRVKKLVGPVDILKRPTYFFSSTHYT